MVELPEGVIVKSLIVALLAAADAEIMLSGKIAASIKTTNSIEINLVRNCFNILCLPNLEDILIKTNYIKAG
ncbi:MAG: hypothetical protein IJJ15_07745 [Ruminococcus sp.]|nr:hypothetical protein [Ruminococcus sp.]